MAKTYNTIGTFTAGQVLTAAEMNEIGENSNNYRVPPMVRCVLSGNLSYTQNTDIAWNSEDFDTDGMHDNVTNNTRITAQTAGFYLVTFAYEYTFSGTITSQSGRLFKNGNALVWDDQIFSRTTTHRSFVATTVKLDPTDYLTCRIEIGGGSNYSITAGGTTHFSAAWLGQTS